MNIKEIMGRVALTLLCILAGGGHGLICFVMTKDVNLSVAVGIICTCIIYVVDYEKYF